MNRVAVIGSGSKHHIYLQNSHKYIHFDFLYNNTLMCVPVCVWSGPVIVVSFGSCMRVEFSWEKWRFGHYFRVCKRPWWPYVREKVLLSYLHLSLLFLLLFTIFTFYTYFFYYFRIAVMYDIDTETLCDPIRRCENFNESFFVYIVIILNFV